MSRSLRVLFRALSPAGARARLSILIFHRVLPEKDPLLPWDPDVAEFERILQFLREHFTVLPLSEAVGRLNDGRLPAAPACITFDDGYADNVAYAMPLLQRHCLQATFFIATGFLDGGRMWNDDVIEALRTAPRGELDLRDVSLSAYKVDDDASRVECYSAILRSLKYFPHARRAEVAREIARRHGVPDASALMMTRGELRDLHAAGFEIGGHTHTHPILELLPDRDAEREMAGGKEQLEELLGAKVGIFAYPNGIPDKDYSIRHAAMAQRIGFAAAVSTSAGAARAGQDVFALPRFLPWSRSPVKFGLQWAANLLHA